MADSVIKKENYFSLSFVLSRVLNSGVIMSIEKNENELKGLEKSISKLTKAKYVALFNLYRCRTWCVMGTEYCSWFIDSTGRSK